MEWEKMVDSWTTLRRVEAFCAVAEEHNWTAASIRLNGGGSGRNRAAWHLVDDFSKDLRPDDPPRLFETVPAGKRERSSRSLTLTIDGERVLPIAKEFLDVSRSLRKALARHTGLPKLACYPAHLRKVLAPLHRGASDQVELVAADDSFREDGGAPLFDMLRSHEVDLVIAPLRRTNKLRHLRLYRWELKAVIPIGWPLASKSGPISVSELADQHLLLSPPTHTSRKIVDQVFRRSGIALSRYYENASTESLLAYVEAGRGVAILPQDALWPSAQHRVERSFAPKEAIWHAIHWRAGEETTDERLPPLLSSLGNIWGTIEDLS